MFVVMLIRLVRYYSVMFFLFCGGCVFVCLCAYE